MTEIKLLSIFPEEKVHVLGIKDLRIPEFLQFLYPEDMDEHDEYRKDALFFIMNPLSNPDNMHYRRNIARDFLSHHKLLPRLLDITDGAGEFKREWLEELSNIEENGGTDQVSKKLKASAKMFVALYSKLKNLIDTLADDSLYSDGLLEFKEACIRLYAEHAFSDLPRAEKLIDTDFSNCTSEFLVGFSDTFAVDSVRLNAISAPSKSGHVKGYKVDATFSVEDIKSIIDSAFESMLAEISNYVNELITIFNDVHEQLKFYRFLTDFCKRISDAGASYSFPQLADKEANITSILGLVDPLEALKFGKTAYKHDILITEDHPGVIVTGADGIGKTAFLRAVCVSQIFAQCGLPIVARDATIAVKSGIFAAFVNVYALSEDPMLRFEAEASQMSKIIETMTPYSLIALNELFETVNFVDACDVLYNIFTIMTQNDIAFFATTHIPKLAERFIEVEKISAYVMETENGKLKKL